MASKEPTAEEKAEEMERMRRQLNEARDGRLTTKERIKLRINASHHRRPEPTPHQDGWMR